MFTTKLALVAFVISLLSANAHAQRIEPAPASVPPNGSDITASVLKVSVRPAGSVQGVTPPGPGDHILYSIRLRIQTSAREKSELPNMVRQGIVIEAFAYDVLASILVNTKIRATLRLTGDTRGVRWWISNPRMLP
jgi:hypothetical protein